MSWPDASRGASFERWLSAIAPHQGLLPTTLRLASSDASFRRYFRVDGLGSQTFVVMDSPPALEDVRPFIQVAQLIEQAGLLAPKVLQQDVASGFLLLTDLGDRLYLGELQTHLAAGDNKGADRLMRDAIHALVQWQLRVPAGELPAYDEAQLRRELAIFPEWCVQRQSATSWTDAEQAQWREACDLLVASALAQPTVAVHRDYMPRNLMVCEPNPGILDFQGALAGPISYDMASLLRDAFISWDEELELDWAVRYWEAARKAGLPVATDFGDFWRDLEWMGLQRHLKVLGIFCRLKWRDGKPHYLSDLPRFYAYAHKVASRYNALRPLSRLLEPLMGAQRTDVYY